MPVFSRVSAVVTAAKGPWELCVSLLCSGKRYSASDNNRETLLKGWSTVDLNLSRKIVDIGKSRLKGIASLTNLLCARYEIVRRYPMPGTGASIGISLEM